MCENGFHAGNRDPPPPRPLRSASRALRPAVQGTMRVFSGIGCAILLHRSRYPAFRARPRPMGDDPTAYRSRLVKPGEP